MLSACCLAVLLSSLPLDPDTALKNYVDAPDASYTWRRSEWNGHESLRLASQTWQGVTWEHDVVLCRPKKGQRRTWVLHITGSDPNAFDVDWSQTLADLSGCPVAVLFHIPNQPIWDKKEDDLIAHTFVRYMETGDETWPALFPMVKSAVRTMDALQEYDRDVKDIVVFGASKRGWTSWLTAATGDKRVVGIAPMLFDNLNMPAQLAKQMKDWGHYSPMIADYTERGLQEVVDSEQGKKLVRMIDPYAYLDTIDVPVMAIQGSCDPYWTTDASSLYWGKVKGSKWSVTVPNLGHAFERTEWWTPSLAVFARMCHDRTRAASATLDGRVLQSVDYMAESESLEFSGKTWIETQDTDSPFNVATFRADQRAYAGIKYWVTTPVKVLRKRP